MADSTELRATLPIRSGDDDRIGDERLAAALAALGLALSAVLGAMSPHGILQFDDVTHFLFAKWAWRWPGYLLHDWGRPGFTTLYFLPAKFGWPMGRVLSAILTAWSAWFAFRIAQRLGVRRAWLVVPLAYVQPMFFELSMTTLTETALAFYLTAAVYLALCGRWTISAAALSLGFVTRHEAIVFLPLWIVFARLEGVRLRRLWPLLWAPLVVNVLAESAGVEPLYKRLLRHESSGQYGQGGWLTFFARSMEAFGPAVAVLAIIGLPRLTRRRGGLLVVACVVLYFSTETAIRALGLFDSGGYARFLVPIAPLVAVAALLGWQALCSAEPQRARRATLLAAAAMALLWISMERQLQLFREQRDQVAELPEVAQAALAVRIATAVIVVLAVASLGIPKARVLVPAALVVMLVLTIYKLHHRLWPPPEAPIIAETLHWLDANGRTTRPVLSAVVWLDYVQGRELPPWHASVREELARAPVGTIFAWERQFAGSPDHNLSLEEFRASPAFRLIHTSRSLPYRDEPYLFLFEKIAD